MMMMMMMMMTTTKDDLRDGVDAVAENVGIFVAFRLPFIEVGPGTNDRLSPVAKLLVHLVTTVGLKRHRHNLIIPLHRVNHAETIKGVVLDKSSLSET